MAERVRLLAAGDGRSSSASLRTDACASSKIASGDFVELGGVVHAPHTPKIKTGLKDRPVFILAERVRFELTCRNYPTIRFRVGAVVTTSVPLQLT